MTGKDFLFPEFWAALPAILLSIHYLFSSQLAHLQGFTQCHKCCELWEAWGTQNEALPSELHQE